MKQENINNNGFKVPKDYFDSFEDTVFEKLSENNLLKNNDYTVPKNYFDTVEGKVLSRLNLIPKKEIKTISLKRIVIKISIAAAFIIMFSLLYLNNNKVNIDQIAVVDIESWLDENIDTIDLYSYTETYNNFDLDELQLFNNNNNNNNNNNEILNLLENTDIESFIDETEVTF